MNIQQLKDILTTVLDNVPNGTEVLIDNQPIDTVQITTRVLPHYIGNSVLNIFSERTT